ncbi:alcohol dehydrogenase catalytic domain-containing protein [Streptomyces sp. NA02950]|uniref:alcohol dehydrogenase catalytic domain-containing protein n=1 Tax=Streptomyces sp. NA02950 TaxID=2742137 RepID=UPI0020CB0EA6|nr:alcohol dehydrogenase catalytic domain-containing protein [Streptomyces sp. NA02950]
MPLPFVPGIEVAGRIRALGDGVEGLTAGQPVAALTSVDSGGYAEVAVTSADLPGAGCPGPAATAAAAEDSALAAFRRSQWCFTGDHL